MDFNRFFIFFFTRILNSSHYLDMIAFAEFFELMSDIEDICFYIGWGAYFIGVPRFTSKKMCAFPCRVSSISAIRGT